MTKQEKYQKLRSRIAELVPGIKKLEFGCEIRVKEPTKYEKYDDVFHTGEKKTVQIAYANKVYILNMDRGSRGSLYYVDLGIDPMEYHSYYRMQVNGSIWEEMVKDGKIEIIGRDPRLSDVLRAISILMDDKNETINQCALNKYGELFFPGDDKARSWNLSQDSLSLQDEPTITFLCDILGV